ncbi:helix-turn-helix domain-containing protein [Filimonas effusa]|uniref:AraC family transcriptional regulator n=1 Tax=Filimonas effusa TaxID=2508721 RepID=A0A4Q1DB35_9BACT|nr:AraC family transcriptional regulator [Filimonas effusa]RXK86641.1 AraC family transcriptional regulator [Filimonas effusa]
MKIFRKKDGFQGQKAIVIPKSVYTAKCTKDPMISNLFITNIGYYPNAHYHFRSRPRGTDQHILIFCHEGKGYVTIESTEYTINPGEFIIIPMKASHTYTADKSHPWTIYWVHFKGNAAQEIVNRFQKNSAGKMFLQSPGKCIDLFNDIYSQLERGYGKDTLAYVNMSFWHFIAAMLFNEAVDVKETKDKGAIEKAIDFLSKNVDKPVTLEEIAAQASLSPAHFSATFKKRTGFSPIEYFTQLKIQKACQYLLFTELRIKEIAQELGIEDPYYFSRLFTKVIGSSPNQYRANRRNDKPIGG